MRKESIKGITVLYADDGAYLTNGEVFTDSVYLGINAAESDWRDATAEEKETWEQEQESEDAEELTAEEALSIITGESE